MTLWFRSLLPSIANPPNVEVELRGRRRNGETFLGGSTICLLRPNHGWVRFYTIRGDISEDQRLHSARLFSEPDRRLKQASDRACSPARNSMPG